MLWLRLTLFPLLLLLATAGSASAQDDPGLRASAGVFPEGFDQAVYKGLVGNVLDAVPMDPSQRLDLQRTNAVLGNTLLGRALAVFAGLGHPVLLLGGFFWGMWAASNIKLAEAGKRLTVESAQSGDGMAAQNRIAGFPDDASSAEDARANSASKTILVSSFSADNSDAVVSHPHVIKIWLPERSPAQSQ